MRLAATTSFNDLTFCESESVVRIQHIAVWVKSRLNLDETKVNEER